MLGSPPSPLSLDLEFRLLARLFSRVHSDRRRRLETYGLAAYGARGRMGEPWSRRGTLHPHGSNENYRDRVPAFWKSPFSESSLVVSNLRLRGVWRNWVTLQCAYLGVDDIGRIGQGGRAPGEAVQRRSVDGSFFPLP